MNSDKLLQIILNLIILIIVFYGIIIIITKSGREGFISISDYNKIYSERIVEGENAPKLELNTTDNFELYPYDKNPSYEQKTNNMKENKKSLRNPPRNGCRRVNYYCSNKILKG